MQKDEVDPYLKPYIKVNSNSKDLNIRPKIIKFLEENIEGKLHGIGLGNDFLDMTIKTQATKAKINRGDYIKLKNFVHQRTQLSE